MCLAVYLGSSLELPESKWNEAAPAFYLEPAGSHEDEARRQFSLPYVYYAGSHEGCGCGFLKEGEVGVELVTHQANYDSLVQRIREVQEKGASVELFSCWEGDQGLAPEFIESLTADEIEDPSFQFKERQFIRICHARKR